jgi:hypothetical protein
MPRDVYTSDRIAPPVGPFSPAVRAGELLYLSGQVAQDSLTGKLVEGGVDTEASQIFRTSPRSSKRRAGGSTTSCGSACTSATWGTSKQ